MEAQQLKTKFYPDIDSNPDFVTIEKEIIKKWQQNNIFEKSVRGSENYIFYDGPPFANGLPHTGHLLTGYIKDIFARYHTMLGKKVTRRFGWDCHGLPVEMGTEKELGISGKLEIKNFGIENFNQHCRASVMQYTKQWQDYVHRQARWVDFNNSYKTMDISYMESILWSFKTLYDKGLIYKSTRVMPYSWACQTPVSNFETRMDNAYRQKESKAVTITFDLLHKPDKIRHNCSQYKLMVWTTTPWTLPSNLAIAVGEEIEYSCIEKEDICYIIASNLAPKYSKEIGDNIVAMIKGNILAGQEYEPILPYFADHLNSFKILTADFVTTEDGTGIVHMAPGFGEDDEILCKRHNIDTICPVDDAGKFTADVDDFVGMHVFDTNDLIIKNLKKQNNWIRTEQYLHNYPHCWRTDTALIYKAISSWYLKVTAIKDQLIQNNQQINWIPSHIKDGVFGKWLENARDWSISRNRYWGCPIPIWQSDDPQYPHIEVYGSIEELETAFGCDVKDLHRPFIDELVKPNPKDPTGKSMMRRIPDVLDCWFESGSMPYAQMHYPFENKEYFEQNFPANFITEYISQTRGWFYTMIVLATALFNKPPFLNCLCHGVILGDDRQKLSKRLKNYTDPNEVFQRLGSDAMRWYLISTPVMRGQEVVIDREGKVFKEVIRLVIKPIWNAYKFFTLYANADGIKAKLDFSSDNLMDQYILSKLAITVVKIKNSMDNYDTVSSTKIVEEFFEILNNWYIRRCRERFWRHGKDSDKVNAYNSLYSVLNVLCRAIAPLLPLIAEKIYQGLTGQESVHLAKFPDISKISINYELIENMQRVRDACNCTHRIRNEVGIRIRQPLSKVVFIGVAKGEIPTELAHLILDEVNVKSWENLSKDEITKFADLQLKLLFPEIGKRLSHKMKDIISANKQKKWKIEDGTLHIAGEILNINEFEVQLKAKQEYSNNIEALCTNDGLVLLDLEISESLQLEGLARDFVRIIQNTRKDEGFDITDLIRIYISSESPETDKMLDTWQSYIKKQTLAVEIIKQNNIIKEGAKTHIIREMSINFTIKLAD